MNWDEAHLLGDLEAQEERRMTDDPVKQTIKELQDIVHCDCAPDYLDRGLHSHVCLHYMAEPVELVANRIEELEAALGKVISAYRMEAIRRHDYTHDAFDRHIAKLTGEKDE